MRLSDPVRMSSESECRVFVFLVEDHALIRRGMALVLEQAGHAIVGEADTAEKALSHLGLAFAQVAVVDLALGQASGLDLIPALCHLGVRVLVCSLQEDPAVVRRALAAGAAGYVTKREVATSLITAIRTIMDGGTFISPRAATALARNVA